MHSKRNKKNEQIKERRPENTKKRKKRNGENDFANVSVYKQNTQRKMLRVGRHFLTSEWRVHISNTNWSLIYE